MASHGISIKRSCSLHVISEGCYRHQAVTDKDDRLRDLIARLAATHPRWGFGLMFGWIRQQGHQWNHKRVYRVYKEMAMNLRIKPKKRLPNRYPSPLQTPSTPNACWSMDFMTDSLTNGDSYRTLNIIDDFNREFLHAEIDKSLPGERVVRALEMAIEQYGKPTRIRVDNGPEFISHVLGRWAQERQVTLDFIQPGKPTQNAYVERFNRSFREEVLDTYAFSNLDEVRDQATKWMWVYNRERPHQALNGATPWHARTLWHATRISKGSHGQANDPFEIRSPSHEIC